MDIVIVGTGYVGLVTGVAFAQMGHNVTCVDIDEIKIKLLWDGVMPIYEPGLSELAIENIKAGRLHFTTQLSSCIKDASVVFCAVGTPPDEDGSADLKYVLAVARQFGQLIDKYTIFVTKSTVPVGTAKKVENAIFEELKLRGENIPFDVVSNPEFLKEGSALEDVMHPDRVVIGTKSDEGKFVMDELYKPFNLSPNQLIFTDIPSAEMIKYAANSMLATRISFMNDIANLCELVGANVESVRKGIGSDTRIGSKFLNAGCGYGGSCFPKDVKALIKTAEQNGYDMQVLNAVENVNKCQKEVLFNKIFKYYNGNLFGKIVTLLGLAFKPETDDMREATSLVLIDKLIEHGATVKVYDPIAINECKRRIGDKVIYCSNIYGALIDSDALMLVTEWNEFKNPDWLKIHQIMSRPVVFDGRNIYDRNQLEKLGFYYDGIGK